MRIARWTLLVPVAVVAWYAVFSVGLFTYFYVERHFCPSEDISSGHHCSNDTIQFVLALLMHLFVAGSAVAVGLCAVSVAPSHKETVAWAVLALGLVVAGYFGISTNDWSLFAAAFFGGTAGAVAIVFFLRRKSAQQIAAGDVRNARA